MWDFFTCRIPDCTQQDSDAALLAISMAARLWEGLWGLIGTYWGLLGLMGTYGGLSGLIGTYEGLWDL